MHKHGQKRPQKFMVSSYNTLQRYSKYSIQWKREILANKSQTPWKLNARTTYTSADADFRFQTRIFSPPVTK